ncbi:pyridine nucleotide-disulfide oxidoreductase [Paraburkholderia panacisoli]|uniref:Pyridine nucleotide-disulfide oxidoreductase n=1 Tax=Paraburkholderia panacisoli TaxID=2603818 RepID=A0A5B0G5C0_9BURK|nr:FAD-dependent oxidoreductase [Paraburkholderia panacisoli]KAA0997781.1 pyridine nucleotide-disulfide oxidoreductase [Paraburkholderia panacisoli]
MRPNSTVVILGAGQAGFQAATSLRQAGFDGRIRLVGDEPCVPYERPPLSKSYLAGETGLDSLWLRPETFYQKERIELELGETAIAIDRQTRHVELASGRKVGYDRLVLATGARFRPLSVPGAELDGVLPLRTLADADALRPRLAVAREVVVIGAGFIGLEFAAVARKAGVGVHIIEMTQRPMGRVVSEQTSHFYTRAHRGWGSEVLLGTGVARILGNGRVSGVETSDGRRLRADLVLISIGVLPNTEIAAAAGLAVDNGIVVDQSLASTDPTIFAIGDCANFPSRFGRCRLESIQNAVDQGQAVAAAIIGESIRYDKVPWFWTDQADLKLQIAGITAGHDRAVLRGDPESRSFSVFFFLDGTLTGVESINRPTDHVVARRLLLADPRLSPEQAVDPEFDLRAYATRLSRREAAQT